ncbi:MAG: ABC transporter permease [Thermosphaera sp.]
MTEEHGGLLRSRVLRRFLRNPLSLLGLLIVTAIVMAAVFAPYLAPYPRDAGPSVNFARALEPPSIEHPFGTDDVGRDILSRTIFGTRLALAFAAIVLGIAMAIGIPLGLLAGYWPHSLASTLILRLTDVFLAVPPLALALAITVAFEPNLTTAMVAVSFAWWPWFTRLVYAETLSIKSEPFIEAAESLGQRDLIIMSRHIPPNILSPIIVKASLDVSFVILLGASLSFLGVGAQEPTPDWGAMVARGRLYLPEHWWISTMPGLAIFVTVVGFNLIGDAIRDALDVRDR